MSRILNYTTTISAHKTAGEAMEYLLAHGAVNVAAESDGKGGETGLSFGLRTPAGLRSYRMPIRAAGVFNVLRGDKTVPARYKTAEQADRVAWRVALVWLKSNIALAEAGLADMGEVLLPWMVADDGRTMYELYREQGPAIEGGRA